LDDYFTVEKVSPGVLLLTGSSASGLVEVRVPREITDHCREGWQVNLLLGKTRNGWCILETGNVYPS
jgi:Uri superfamily endonuclease